MTEKELLDLISSIKMSIEMDTEYLVELEEDLEILRRDEGETL